MTVGVIDYGVGNLGSVLGAIEQVGEQPCLINCTKEVSKADCLILPGVGHFGTCAQLLIQTGWFETLKTSVLASKKPILGICLGMQLLADSSEEGFEVGVPCQGLGLIPGKVRHLRSLECQKRLPHVGWNSVRIKKQESLFLQNIPDSTDFYFVHNYAFVPENPAHISAITTYGISFASAVQNEHIWGTQFHPEKSSRAGLKILNNFLASVRC